MLQRDRKWKGEKVIWRWRHPGFSGTVSTDDFSGEGHLNKIRRQKRKKLCGHLKRVQEE